MEVAEFASFLAVVVVVYTVVGFLLLLRRNRKQISSRSPFLLLLSHVGNTCQSVALLVQMTPQAYDPAYGDFIEAAEVFCHYLFYFPYLLRGYRLYFVFHTEIGKSAQNDSYFLKHIRRAKQSWLLCVLAGIMTPIAIGCILRVLVPRLWGGPKYSSNTDLYEKLYILNAFAEEMLFVLLIYSLRHVDREYCMNRELTLVCFLWYFNVIFSGRSTFTFWMYELLIRNTLIMLISVFYPLFKSYRRPEMKESLTLQSMYSLTLVLENQLPHEYFEEFLKQPSLQDNPLEPAGHAVLQLYCLCRIYQAAPNDDLAHTAVKEVRELQKSFALFPEPVISAVLNSMEANKPWEELLRPVEQFLFSLLDTHFFPLFKRSKLFGILCRFIEQSELRAGRVKSTSLVGEDSV